MKNILTLLALIFGVGIFAATGFSCSKAKMKNVVENKQEEINMEGKNIKEIYFAGGCFWGTEHLFQLVRGVVATEVGYANGKIENPTYEQVISHSTGFAEAVKVKYDADEVDLPLLISLYFKSIDPTTIDRQGNDVGDNYRSGIYSTDATTEAIVKAEVAKLAKNYTKPVVVETIPLENFYKAEDYHQDYLINNPNGYCHVPLSVFEEAKNANPLPTAKK
ncbi:peptide-methionine (S)-S-oxide reductase MsrA [Chryseobacterium sp. SNU WT5]|uniref:peptide-methionine (S)-S-oxide reductase MsrA n=1 Tax=Chryseobacterium sp. SNU WT5 TaxID=2594269 RepID=UPI00117FDE7E|nr:peptide-methionine (S)-S-oxide reductase MsrA [Chryseobacterium sp. SNU WT5]QDP86120.1 peptide-methionine (S)-S-oxide reductase MsrA [Chryseobacterium sp. SNU WT5]